MKTKTRKKKRPPSPKMLAHLRRLHKLMRSCTIARRKALEAKRAKDRARKAAKRAAKHIAP